VEYFNNSNSAQTLQTRATTGVTPQRNKTEQQLIIVNVRNTAQQ